jgi:hypothetical protein
MFTPPFFHWYAGDEPPFKMLAVKVTDVPAQIAPLGLAVIEIVGTTLCVTVIVMLFEVTVAGEGQTAFDVISTVITSPLLSVVEL